MFALVSVFKKHLALRALIAEAFASLLAYLPS
jgi:hypothetical protein